MNDCLSVVLLPMRNSSLCTEVPPFVGESLQNLSLVLWSVLLNNSCQSHPKDDPFSPLLRKSSILYYENRQSCITKIVSPLLRKSSVLHFENQRGTVSYHSLDTYGDLHVYDWRRVLLSAGYDMITLWIQCCRQSRKKCDVHTILHHAFSCHGITKKL